MGAATIFWLRRLGAAKIVAIDIAPWREGVALEMGADAFFPSTPDLDANIAQALGGPPDIVCECAGAPGVIAKAIELVRLHGTVLSIGGCQKPDQFIPFVAMSKDISLLFSAAYVLDDFQFTVDTLERGSLEPRRMITETFPLHQVPAALEAMRHNDRQCKVMIDPWMS